MRPLFAALALFVLACTSQRVLPLPASSACPLRSGALTGTVLERGRPVAGAVLHLSHEQSDVVTEVRTDSQGRFTFGCIAATRYTLAVVAPRRTAGQMVNVRTGRETSITLRIWP